MFEKMLIDMDTWLDKQGWFVRGIVILIVSFLTFILWTSIFVTLARIFWKG